MSASNSGVVDQLKALSRRLNKLSAEVTRVGNAIDEVEEYSYQFNVKIIGPHEKSNRYYSPYSFYKCKRELPCRVSDSSFSLLDN